MPQKPTHTAPPPNSQAVAYGYEYIQSMASHGVAQSHTVTKLKHSSSWITNEGGNVNQYLAYTSTMLSTGLPFGEQFIDQRQTGHDIRFKFTGKERDTETGYSYFGARYYDSGLSVWLSARPLKLHSLHKKVYAAAKRRWVDPLADKYPSMSPFMYTAGNPVMLVDPDGRRIWITGDNGDRIEYKQGMKYDGDNEQITARVNTLNKMNGTKNGNKVLTELTSSENDYNVISGGEGKKGYANFCGNDDIDGQAGGTISTNGNDDNLSLISHEMFHAYQDEMGQGGSSSHNELEAMLFSESVVDEYTGGFSSTSYTLADNPNSNMGKKYESSVNAVRINKEFSKKDFIAAYALFKFESASSNSKYRRMPTRRNNQKKDLIKNFYPLLTNE